MTAGQDAPEGAPAASRDWVTLNHSAADLLQRIADLVRRHPRPDDLGALGGPLLALADLFPARGADHSPMAAERTAGGGGVNPAPGKVPERVRIPMEVELTRAELEGEP